MTALAVSNGRTQVTWKAPSSTGGRPVLGYRYCRVGCAVATSWRGVGSSHGVPLRSLLLTSLIKGRTYVVYVRAVNAIGDGPMVKLAFRQKR
jgi:hypothetical protein